MKNTNGNEKNKVRKKKKRKTDRKSAETPGGYLLFHTMLGAPLQKVLGRNIALALKE